MSGLEGTITMKSGEYRPCLVNGKKALFHRWIEKDQAIIKLNYMLKKENVSDIRKKFEEFHVLPNGATPEKIRNTFGIVEYENGTIKEVEATSVKFLDSSNLFVENSLFFQEV